MGKRALSRIPRTFSAGLIAAAVLVVALALALAVPGVSKQAHRLGGSSAQVQAEARYLTISDSAARYVLVSDKVARHLSAGGPADPAPFLTKTDAATIYLKIDEAAIKYLKLDEAAATYLSLEEAAHKYLKIDEGDLKYLKVDEAVAEYLKISEADFKYLKVEDATAEFLKIDASFAALDQKYVKLEDAHKYVTVDELAAQKFVTLAELDGYLKIGDLQDYKFLTLAELDAYLKLADGSAYKFVTPDELEAYKFLKAGEAVAGDGAVFTGFAALTGEQAALLKVPGVADVRGRSLGQNEGAEFVLIALSPVRGGVSIVGEDGSTFQSVELDAGETQAYQTGGSSGLLTLQLVTESGQVATITVSGDTAGPAPHMTGQGLVTLPLPLP